MRLGWRSARRGARQLTVGVRTVWRRSLSFRMVSITTAAATVLVASFGYLLAWSSGRILIEGTAADVRTRIASGVTYAEGQLSVHGHPADPRLPGTLSQTAYFLAGSPSRPSQPGGPIVAFKARNLPDLRPTSSEQALDVTPLISAELERQVAQESRLAYQVRTGTVTGRPVKYLVYGAPLVTRFGTMQLYYIWPLSTQDDFARQIQFTVLVTGLALIALLAVLANLVTRMVVNPVRVAARTAQRLSAGLLDQRMSVRGEDDLALLAASFNQMAGNLQRQIVRLEEMSRLQRRFTSDVSHELRTPLTTVRMAADLIFSERDEFSPAVTRSAELLQAELDRFESLLSDLLEISRFDAGFAVLDLEPTDLVPMLRRVADQFAGLARSAGAPVRLDVPESAVIADVDPRRIERVLRNLVGNAIEHAEGAPVEVTLAAGDAAVAIAVRDRGVGLKPGEEKLVFSRFWRADPSRARQTGGTGLGLSISLEDARLHGGWLEAWGTPGGGAQFRLTLPLRGGDRLIAAPLPLVPADAAVTEGIGPAPEAAP
ncbi:MtrAB system histidine kinase MtrB [Pilimelia terevasa]|uniref:MtrAB system histidine kinase MtrB n=1 Tax=Pilimelia terevasa TaxID=53372 RepID=UPI003571573E